MPELPEVETVRRGIEPHVLGRTIEQVTVRERRLRWPVPADFARRLEGRRVRSVERRAKYLLLDLGEDRLILHLGMSGRLLVLEPGHPLRKHDHLDVRLSGGVLLRLNDPRRFGAALLWPRGQASHPLLENLGPEPFSDEFSGEYLFELSRGRSAAVKNFLMDGRVVVGAGNIYAAEALFRAGIRPGRAAGRLTRADCARLAAAVREVLVEAVAQGGTTLRDFAGADGAPGYFRQKLFVYGRAGEPCLRCGTAIKRLVIGQRSSFYCPGCQQ
ncbi:MAG: bifunctional DNA-formamidopyrimidine glycosylase/DNA-(apurinic or apyrimidinic site) lyase [Gammaproteobacteria bacterium]|nr:bifunctional DNA-formamidopyrimidine glycosylase/DNA-(apurinic or apyrimidinic site) lyase [Gammaproteobacteria bacterium]